MPVLHKEPPHVLQVRRSFAPLRGAQALLLSFILVSRLLSELRLIVSRALSEDEWDLELVMEILQWEIEARERSVGATPLQPKNLLTKPPPTALSLTTSAIGQASSVYCDQPHASDSCTTIRDPEERKQKLHAGGCCFVCLRQNYISQTC